MQVDAAAPLVAGYDGLIVDADGVLFRGPVVVDHAVDSLTWVSKEVGLTWGVVTNNAAHAPRDVAAKLQGLGFDVDASRVITSPQGAARYLRDHGVAAGARVLVVGGPGIDEALQAAGFDPVRELGVNSAPGNGVAAVVQGFGPDLRWADLAQAAYAIEAGALWVATNGDLTLPTAEAWRRATVRWCSGGQRSSRRIPDAITGKPEPLLTQVAAEQWGLRRPLVVGDRIDTDIRGGNRAGMDTLLVLTGVTGSEQLTALREAAPQDRPTYIARDLRALRAPAALCRVLEGTESVDGDELSEVRSLLRRAWGD